MRLIFASLFAFLILPAFSMAQALPPEAVRQVDAALVGLSFPSGAQVVSAVLDGNTLRLEFSTPTSEGISDSQLESLTDAVRAAYRSRDGISNYALTAKGRSLADYLPPLPAIAPAPTPPGKLAVGVGALSGKKIAISPGHGWTYSGSWVLQRGYWQGIVEDFLNPEFMQYLNNLLVNNGATVYPCRELDKTYGNAASAITFAGSTRPAPGKPWWQMASLYYTQRAGAPSSVYDNGRDTDYNRDIAARPLYANWRSADLMVSLHNNGSAATGTETLYDNSNSSAANSAILAKKIQSRVVSEVRAHYLSSWTDRTAQGFAGSYGENRIANCPAILIEVAFMDTPTPDNAALHSEKFKMLVAKAIYEGICDYLGVTPTWNSNVAAPGGQWTASALPKTWSLNLGSPISAPPSSAGGWVYAATEAGSVHGVAATAESGYTPGTQRWRYPTSGGIGAAILARPTVYGDAVYAISKAGRLVALDAMTGALRWNVLVPNSGNLVSSPAATPDGFLVLGSDNGRIYSYRQDTGALVKAFPTAFGAINAEVAIPDSGHVWVSSADGKVRCISGDLGAVLWETDTGAAVTSAPYVLTSNNAVYFVNAAKTLLAMNASNGSPAAGWSSAGATFGVNIGTSAWADAASNVAVFGMDNHAISGTYVNSAAVPSDFPLRPFGVREFTATPVVYNGVIYVGGMDGRFYALKRNSGVASPGAAWRAFDANSEAVPGQFPASACLTGTAAGDLVVAGNTNGALYAFPM
ncbi:MAG TPA: PQQ-binding-like beta-propeller repeat protein [Armatimonadota bacterium]|jgi:outer membrane protein assembly factor BamB/N-acetylmuramoyl-L-alanine amidase